MSDCCVCDLRVCPCVLLCSLLCVYLLLVVCLFVCGVFVSCV